MGFGPIRIMGARFVVDVVVFEELPQATLSMLLTRKWGVN